MGVACLRKSTVIPLESKKKNKRVEIFARRAIKAGLPAVWAAVLGAQTASAVGPIDETSTTASKCGLREQQDYRGESTTEVAGAGEPLESRTV